MSTREVNPWAKHRQSFWQEKSGSPNLPLWLRVTALAYGTHRRNGHAPFQPGEISLACSVVDTHGEVIRVPISVEISRAISVAREYGFLAPGSNARCLVVPHYGIEGGVLGRIDERCTLHSGQRGRRSAGGRGGYLSELTNGRNLSSESKGDYLSELSRNASTCTDGSSLYESSNGDLPNAKRAPTKPHNAEGVAPRRIGGEES